MFTYQRDAAQVAQFANQYNFDELVACLTDYLDPKAAAKHLKLIYFDLLVKTGAETPQKQENATL